MNVVRTARALLLMSLASGAPVAAQNAAGDPPEQGADREVQQPGQARTPPGPGEPPAPTPEELARQRPIVFQLRARSELGFNADLRDAPGDVTILRLGGGLSAQVPVRQLAQLDVGLDYEYSHYAFDDATGFVPGVESPWEDIHRETLSLRFSQQHSARLGWFVGGSIGLAHEDGADPGDSITLSGFGGVRYAISESLTLGGGVAVVSQLEDSAAVYPLITVDWAISERVRLTNGGRLGLAAAYDASEHLTFSFGASYERREFRLRDDGPAPDGVGRDQRIPVAAGLAYRPTPKLSIELAGGASFAQSLRLSDSRGNTISDIDAKPAPFASVLIGYRF